MATRKQRAAGKKLGRCAKKCKGKKMGAFKACLRKCAKARR